jgi:hypothetical protein
MSEPIATSEIVLHRPQDIPGYDYGTERAATSPLTLEDLRRLKEAVWLTREDEEALGEAAEILEGQAAEMVAFYRRRLGEQPWLAPYSQHPDGSPNPEYGAATKPRFDRWIIDACTRPLDQDWLDYQHEIGLRHTAEKKNTTDDADSAPLIPMRYVLAFAAVVIATAREFLANGAGGQKLDRLHAAFTKSVMLHVTVWTRAYNDSSSW